MQVFSQHYQEFSLSREFANGIFDDQIKIHNAKRDLHKSREYIYITRAFKCKTSLIQND